MLQNEDVPTLRQLPVPLALGDRVDMFCAVKAWNVGRSDARHAVGLIIRHSKSPGPEEYYWTSERDGTNGQRGELAAVLTSLEWCELNVKEGAAVTIWSRSEYVYAHLKGQLKQWLNEPKRANLDLLSKIDAHSSVLLGAELRRVDENSMDYLAAGALAASEVGGEDVEEPMTEEEKMLMERALERDRS